MSMMMGMRFLSFIMGGALSLTGPLFRGSSRFESLIVSHHSGFSIILGDEKEINDE